MKYTIRILISFIFFLRHRQFKSVKQVFQVLDASESLSGEGISADVIDKYGLSARCIAEKAVKLMSGEEYFDMWKYLEMNYFSEEISNAESDSKSICYKNDSPTGNRAVEKGI
ncbi:MAG TPA: hypothetical protein DCO79_03230 [Spirochaeta sp.]|nr:hypothetical protein [Spirochaeta sp.]